MEFQTIAEGICEFIWLEILIKDLQLPVLHHRVLYGHTKSTISFVNNLVQQPNEEGENRQKFY